nr:retinol dehydrogenase 8-like [Lytechinus pictus]
MAPQIVLMTGCSTGMGLAMVQRLARDPDHRFIIIATVIAMSEKTDLEAAVKDDIDKTVFIKELDITKDDNITEVVENVINDHGRIDILLNIAGLAIVGIPERLTREQIDKTFNVNVIGTIRLTQAVLPHMKEKQSGKIITISSIVGRLGVPYNELYSSSKFAVEGFFEGLAAGLRAFNIRVCLIEPRQVQTELLDGLTAGLKASAEDESAFDIDRRQLRKMLGRMEAGAPPLTREDIVDAVITRCIDVEKPVFRHFLGGRLAEILPNTLGDLTGESTLAIFGFEAVNAP